jgi:hypothetical protein
MAGDSSFQKFLPKGNRASQELLVRGSSAPKDGETLRITITAISGDAV